MIAEWQLCPDILSQAFPGMLPCRGELTGVCPQNIPVLLLGLSQICGYEVEAKPILPQSGTRGKQALFLVV